MTSPSVNQLEGLAREALKEGRDETAYQLLGKILQQEPEHVTASYLLSYIAHKYGNYQKEVELLQKIVSNDPDNLLFRAYYARALVLCGDMLLAHQELQAIDVEATDNPELVDTVATTYNRLNLYTEACRCYQRLVQLDANSALVWFNLSTCYKYLGEFEKAREALEKSVSLKPHFEKSQAALSLLNTKKNNVDADISDRISELTGIQEKSKNPEARLHIAHAIAKELESIGEYSRAFTVLASHKDALRHVMKYDFDYDKGILDKIVARPSYSVDKVNHVDNIFVTGMPRTGTTLVDRILSSADNVISGGELPCFRTSLKKVLGEASTQFITNSCVQDLENNISREVGHLYRRNTSYLNKRGETLVDKLPMNIVLADQILKCINNSVIICLDRHPLDTIVGNYRQLFSFADAGFNYSLSLIDTARFYLFFRNLTQRLRQSYPDRFYLINYENLVRNPEQESKKLFDFCHLTWCSDYLSIEKNSGPVATASALQVREKIHTNAISQWRRYADHLDEVKHLLQREGIAYE